MNKKLKSFMLCAFAATLLFSVTTAGICASVSLSATPTDATSNSLYWFTSSIADGVLKNARLVFESGGERHSINISGNVGSPGAVNIPVTAGLKLCDYARDPVDDSGTIASISGVNITARGTWVTDFLVDAVFEVTTGPARGKTAIIVSNTGDAITLDTDLSIYGLAAGDSFRLVPTKSATVTAVNGPITVTSDTGLIGSFSGWKLYPTTGSAVGYSYDILSNNAYVITLASKSDLYTNKFVKGDQFKIGKDYRFSISTISDKTIQISSASFLASDVGSTITLKETVYTITAVGTDLKTITLNNAPAGATAGDIFELHRYAADASGAVSERTVPSITFDSITPSPAADIFYGMKVTDIDSGFSYDIIGNDSTTLYISANQNPAANVLVGDSIEISGGYLKRTDISGSSFWGTGTLSWICPSKENIIYAGFLRAYLDGSARTWAVTIEGQFEPGKTTISSAIAVTVHDSYKLNGSSRSSASIYGGQVCDRDYLEGYLDAWNDGPDPLATTYPSVIGGRPSSLSGTLDTYHPVDGASTTTYKFSVKYINEDGLPPQPYISSYTHPWWMSHNDFKAFAPSGVNLYMAYQPDGKYDPTAGIKPYDEGYYAIPMQPDPENPGVYTYTFKPTARNNYCPLFMGKYKYYFACSDDIIRDVNGDILPWLEKLPQKNVYTGKVSGKSGTTIIKDTEPQWVGDAAGYQLTFTSGNLAGHVYTVERSTLSVDRTYGALTLANADISDVNVDDKYLLHGTANVPGNYSEYSNNLALMPQDTTTRWRSNFYHVANFVDRVTYEPGGKPFIDEPIDERFSFATNNSSTDFLRFIDKGTEYRPGSGYSNFGYKYRSDQHPIVSGSLYPTTVGSAASIRGRGIPQGLYELTWYTNPWVGTLSNYIKRYYPVNVSQPALPTVPFVPGIEKATKVNFEVQYRQLDNIWPEDASGETISVWIDDTANGTGTYVEYPLKRDPTALQDNISTTGTTYRLDTPISLPAGPHTYYFTCTYTVPDPSSQNNIISVADDVPWSSSLGYTNQYPQKGYTRTIRWPYDANSGVGYFPGPYVNRGCTLTPPSEGTVTPTSGSAGENFKFSIIYTSADNQPPASTWLYIKYNDDPNKVSKVQMMPVGASTDYASGVTYTYNSSSLGNAFTTASSRQYKFEFQDDWGGATTTGGYYSIPGETAVYPATGWISGPTVNPPAEPILNNGTITSLDGASTSVTPWTFSVKYTNTDGRAPTYVKTYIGTSAQIFTITDLPASNKLTDNTQSWMPNNLLVPSSGGYTVKIVSGKAKGKTYTIASSDQNTLTFAGTENLRADGVAVGDEYQILGFITWDRGHAMTAAQGTPISGQVYTYTTQLNGTKDGVQYYYSFVASDGVKPALQSASSPSAHAFVEDIPAGSTLFTPKYSQLPGYRLVGIQSPYDEYGYPKAYHKNGAELIYGTDYTVDYTGGTVTFASPTAEGDYVYYYYGVTGPTVITPKPPILTGGGVTPIAGKSTDTYKFTVSYHDLNGKNGQGPLASSGGYIRVKIDGQYYDMQMQDLSVTEFLSDVPYEVDITLGIGPHSYYFEASNGGGSACFDKKGSHSSAVITDTINSVTGLAITGSTHTWPSGTDNLKDYQLTFTSGALCGKVYTITGNDSTTVTLAGGSDLAGWAPGDEFQIKWVKPVPIPGPWVNDPPVLSNALITPSGNIPPSKQVVYSVTYSEGGGNPPEGGYPAVHVDSKPVSVYAAIATACQGRAAGGGNSSVTMSGTWPDNTFAGQQLYVQSGLARGKSFLIKSSITSADQLSTILILDESKDIVTGDGFAIGDTFRVGVEVTNVSGNTITDEAQNWTVDLKDATVRFSGDASSKFYIVDISTVNMLSLLESDGTPADLAKVKVGDKLSFIYRIDSLEEKGDGSAVITMDTSKPWWKAWTPHQFQGMPMQITGKYNCYTIQDNDDKSLTLIPGTYLESKGVLPGDAFTIGRLDMSPTAVGYYDYKAGVDYTVTVPVLLPLMGGNKHSAFFNALTRQSTAYIGDSGTVVPIIADAWAVTPMLAGPTVVTAQGTLDMVFTPSSPSVAKPVTISGTLKADVSGKYPIGNPGDSVLINVILTPPSAEDLPVTMTIPATLIAGKQDWSYMGTWTPTKIGIWNTSASWTDPKLVYANVTTDNTVMVTGYAGTLTIACNPTNPVLDSTATISGTLTLEKDSLLPGAPEIILNLTKPSGEVVQETVIATGGVDNIWNYSYSWTPAIPGGWAISASWDGGASFYGSIQSIRIYPQVASAAANITVACPSASVGKSVNITGALTQQDAYPITTRPDIKVTLTPPIGKGSDIIRLATVTSLASPWTYTLPWVFSADGIWTVSAVWDGNATYSPISKSTTVAISPMDPKQLTGNNIEMIALPVWPIYPLDPERELGLNSSGVKFSMAVWAPLENKYKIWTNVSGYSSDADFPALAPGVGLWIETDKDASINPEGPAVDSVENFGPIELKRGWNLIGNPYLQDIDWVNMQISYQGMKVDIITAADSAHKWVLDYGFIWEKPESESEYRYCIVTNRSEEDMADGSLYRSVPSWHGYWVKALVDCQLYIKAPAGANGASAVAKITPAAQKPMSASAALPATRWTVRIGATNGDQKDDKNYFGVNTKKEESIECPAYPSGYVDLYLTNPRGTARYMYDIKSGEKTGQTWRFKVIAVTPGDVILTWDGLESVTLGTRLILFDETAGVSQEMVAGGSYSYSWHAGDAERVFKIVIADK